MPTDATDQSLVEERWPHIAALHRLVTELGQHQSTHHLGGMPDGQDIVTAIKAWEISNGKAWRS